MAIRITGLNSGMDTDSMVQELVKASSSKKEKLEKAQTKLEWKQDAWKEMNTKIYNFYNKWLSNMMLEGSYTKKKTTIADSSLASIVSSDNAVNGTQTLSVQQLAKSGYLTGGSLQRSNGGEVKSSTSLYLVMGDTLNMGEDTTIKVNNGEKESVISLSSGDTMEQIAQKFKNAGVSANYDETNHRFYISANGSGEAKDFSITAGNANGLKALTALGLTTMDEINANEDSYKSMFADEAAYNSFRAGLEAEDSPVSTAVRIKGQDAKITLNGATYTSESNNFNINGITITANKTSDIIGYKNDDPAHPIYAETVISTADDVDSVYNMIKDFLKEYNELIKEIDTKYNADSAKGYEPLTDEEKDAMNDTEIEKWEKKIKDSLLRRDNDLNKVGNVLKQGMLASMEIGGEKYSLASFGIETLGYFKAPDNERGVFHIAGDEDDEYTSSENDKLKAMIASNPEVVTKFFTSMITDMKNNVAGLMERTDYRSIYHFYDDKKMQSDYDAYKSKIKTQEDKLTALEDRYYKQFSRMEQAMSKLNSQQSYLSNLFGG